MQQLRAGRTMFVLTKFRVFASSHLAMKGFDNQLRA